MLILLLAGSGKEAANGSRNGKTLNFIVVLLFAGCFVDSEVLTFCDKWILGHEVRN